MSKRQMVTGGMVVVLLLAVVVATLVQGRAKDPSRLEMRERVEAYWFDFTVTSVEAAKSYQDYTAPAGRYLAICKVTIKSRVEQPVAMGRTDFLLLWDEEEESTPLLRQEMSALYPLSYRGEGQLPDHYTMERGDSVTGVLLYEVPEQAHRIALFYEEYFANPQGGDDYSVGEQYTVRLRGECRGLHFMTHWGKIHSDGHPLWDDPVK